MNELIVVMLCAIILAIIVLPVALIWCYVVTRIMDELLDTPK